MPDPKEAKQDSLKIKGSDGGNPSTENYSRQYLNELEFGQEYMGDDARNQGDADGKPTKLTLEAFEARKNLKAVADTLMVHDPLLHGEKNPFKTNKSISEEESEVNKMLYEDIKDAAQDIMLNEDELIQNKALDVEIEKQNEKQAMIPKEDMGVKFNTMFKGHDGVADPIIEEAALQHALKGGNSMPNILRSIDQEFVMIKEEE